jgi:Flp pilus assembly protein TadG
VARDNAGVTVVEFALIAPALLLSILGIMDIGYNIYTQTLLRGAIQKAARDSSIEGSGNSVAAIDARVTRAVREIAPNADIDFNRMAYTNFSDVAVAEDFTDLDNDGQCNNGEPFEDVNGNNSWDADRGSEGQGGARDAVLYTVNVRYDRAFPLAPMIGLPSTVGTSASTVLRNQPFGLQQATVTVGNCT